MPPAPTKADLAKTLAESLTSTQLNLPTPPQPALNRHCLITVGATAPFTPLISAALHPSFLAALITSGYTRLIIQAGADAERLRPATMRFAHPTLRIDCFDFVDDLKSVMVLCRREEGGRDAGVVICHAGKFSFLVCSCWCVCVWVCVNVWVYCGRSKQGVREANMCKARGRSWTR